MLSVAKIASTWYHDFRDITAENATLQAVTSCWPGRVLSHRLHKNEHDSQQNDEHDTVTVIEIGKTAGMSALRRTWSMRGLREQGRLR